MTWKKFSDDLEKKFGFLLDLKSNSTDKDRLKAKCHEFGEFYINDINSDLLYKDIEDFLMLMETRVNTDILNNPINILKFIIGYGNDVFPDLRIALQILLTIAISIATCERSFSKLKLILNYARSTMTQSRLSSLALLSIERENFLNIDFDGIIDTFASTKARKADI